jgi:DNA-directed RNA polymerase specialized sigma24 family protein
MRNNPLATEDELLSRLREGDKEAFSEIYNRYWEKLLAVAFFHTREKQAAEDIVHDVMLSLWTRKSELHIQALNAYLAKAVKFAVFKAIMRQRCFYC